MHTPPSTTDTSDRVDDTVDPRVERSRAAVVDAAAGLLLGEGVDAVTHARVASAAGVSRTTVYRYYPERTDLVRATLDAVDKTIPDASMFVGELRPDLCTLIDLLAKKMCDDSHCMMMSTMMTRALHDDVVAQVRNAMMHDINRAFCNVLEPAIMRGELRADLDVERAVASLVGSLIFSRLLANRDVDDSFVGAVIDDFVSTNAPR